jgi:DNA repair protein NreA
MATHKKPNRGLCLECKGGRLLCGNNTCPLLAKVDSMSPANTKLRKDLFGPSTSAFIGWKGYPNVYAGPMTSLDFDRAETLDNPGSWYGLGFDDIIQARSLLVRGRLNQNIRNTSRFVRDLQELTLSVKPVDVESRFNRPPRFSIEFSPVTQPMGASGSLEKMRVVDNPVIPRRVDYIIGDELTAAEQITHLFDTNLDVYYISNVLSSGALGADDKRMVPTRWGITAVDDMLGKELIRRIRDYPPIQSIQSYENYYLENHFIILLIPGAWEFEQFEAWAPDTLWTRGDGQYTIVQDNEGHGGRTKYAINEGGGYYAGRFAVAEALSKMAKSARCVVFREIHEGYVVPVGVWEVRENIRAALQNKPRKHDSIQQALQDINSKLKIPVSEYVSRSQILRQKRITDYA